MEEFANGNSKKDERIHCAACGKLFGCHDAEYVWMMTEIGEPVAPYTGPLLLLKEVITPPLPRAGEKDDPGSQYWPLDEPVDRSYRVTKLNWHLDYKGRKGRKVIRWLWDGESWLKPASPFCSFECQKKKNPTFWQEVQARNKNKE